MPAAGANGWGFGPRCRIRCRSSAGARTDPRVHYAFGHGHLGLTQAAASGRLDRRCWSSGMPAAIDLDPVFGAAVLTGGAAMTRHSFFCIDGHTCGNPVRLVAGGGPLLDGATMMERRAHFLAEYRLDPHRADVRAARPRRDVGLDPLSADARRLRHRHPVHRDLRLPADVRPRHHRHGDDGHRARAGQAEDPGHRSGSTRRPGWSIAEYSQDGELSSRRCASPTCRPSSMPKG